MSNFIIRIIQKITLRRIDNHRKKGYISICDAKKVGFIFKANEEGIEDAISILEKQLQAHKIEFQGIAIDLSEEQVGIPKFQSDPYVINLYKSDIDWIGIPTHELVKKFLENKFDIFIDLTLENIFTLDYILKCANTSLIVGFSPKKVSEYDILIKSSENTSPTVSEYVVNALDYLTTIKSNK